MLGAKCSASSTDLLFERLPSLLERGEALAVLLRRRIPRPAGDLGSELRIDGCKPIEQVSIARSKRSAERGEAVGHSVEDASPAPEQERKREACGLRVCGRVLHMQGDIDVCIAD